MEDTKQTPEPETASSNASPSEPAGLVLMTADEIENIADTEYVTVSVPEWGPNRGVRLGSLSAAEMLRYVEDNRQQNAGVPAFRLVKMSLVDAAGVRIGTDAMVSKFADKRNIVINRLAEAAMKLNGLGESKGGKPLPASEGALGNASGAAGTGDSPTA